MRRDNRPPRSGFTLAELIVVLAVIAILWVVVSLGTESFIHPRMQSTAQITIARARALALKSGHPVEDSVLVERTSYRIRAMPDGGILADSILNRALAESDVR